MYDRRRRGKETVMFKKSHPLQSSSEILLRNIVVTVLVVFFTVFMVIPIIIAFIGSFHDWNPMTDTFAFLGLDNYKNMFASEVFWRSMKNTLIFTLVAIAFRVGLGLALACGINSTFVKAKKFFRGIYYMPVVTPMIAVAFVWKFMLNPQIGVINQLLGTKVNWLANPQTAMIGILALTIWKDFGYAIVMFIAGLYAIPEEAQEAARIDGASAWQAFRYITWPLLKPMTLFVVIQSIISYLQAYVQVLVMTEGGPGTSTFMSSYLIYDEAFVKYNFGYASAISMILFVVTAILSYLSFKVSGDEN